MKQHIMEFLAELAGEVAYTQMKYKKGSEARRKEAVLLLRWLREHEHKVSI